MSGVKALVWPGCTTISSRTSDLKRPFVHIQRMSSLSTRLLSFRADTFASDSLLRARLRSQPLGHTSIGAQCARASMLCSPVLKTFPRLDLDMILEGKEVDLEKQRAYAARLQTTLASAQNGHAFFNGKHFDLDDVRRPPLMLTYSSIILC